MSMINCPNCGNPVKDQAAFCTKCGTKLDSLNTGHVAQGGFCTNCGSPLEPEAEFCTKCGMRQTPIDSSADTKRERGDKKKKSDKPNKSGKGWKIAAIVMAVLLVLGIAGGVYAWISYNNSGKDAEVAEEEGPKAPEPEKPKTEKVKESKPKEEEAAPAPAAEAAPAAAVAATANKKVGISFPTSDLQRWYMDGNALKDQLQAAGYEVDLKFAGNDVSTQVSQIEGLIDSDCECLIIAAIDGYSLGTVLEKARSNNIPVISYDRLIMNPGVVSYYITFDNYLVGAMQGQYIVDSLGLDSQAGPFNIELITGDPEDYNALVYYYGAYDVLEPYIDSGKLVVRSGQVDFEDVATDYWSTENAAARMSNIISKYYSGGKNLDAVMASNDSTAQGVVEALDSNYNGKWPVITGQDCDIVSVHNIIIGKQSMSVFKDTREIVARTVDMADAIMKGQTVPVNDTESYNTGSGNIPSYLCKSVVVDAGNYKKLLIEAGYYTESDLQ
ncbi:MAG: substrate-binding domain-containing protein [Lachnospiraceae bacterium]|nr:substrate-binding domain-containing protein [Lachnospiraceae bacterium]